MILMGFQGVGKTTLGQKLAGEFHCPFYDLDQLMLEAYEEKYPRKMDIRSLHQKLGEESFRELEHEVLSTLQVSPPFILSIGGGTVLLKKNHPYLKKMGPLIYLKLPKEEVKKKVIAKGFPSYLSENQFDEDFESLWQKREPLFTALANYSIPPDYEKLKKIFTNLNQG